MKLSLGLSLSGTAALGRAVLATHQSRLLALSPTGYWPLNDSSGSGAADISGNGRNLSYAGTPVRGQDGIGDGNAATLFEASESANDIALAWDDIINGNQGTISWWMKTSVWTAQTRWLFRLNRSNGDRIAVATAGGTANQLFCARTANGTATNFSHTFSPSGPTAWAHLAYRWDRAGENAARLFVDGASVAATGSALGDWSAASGDVDFFIFDIGGGNDGIAGAHAAIWTRALSAAEIASLATV